MAYIDNFFNWFISSFSDKYSFESKAVDLHNEVCLSTNGWASPGKIHVLHNALICMEPNEQYLEIGTYTGRSLAGALRLNDRLAQVVDPFELFLPDGLGIYQQWLRTVQKFSVLDRVTLHKALFENFSEELPPIGVLYVDGNHDSGYTYETLKRAEKYLSNKAIIIVDDYLLFGGYLQKPYPGYSINVQDPVRQETDRWLLENNDKASLVCVLPWENHSALIRYERN